jgi:1-acyl-sn-glycerol-3-phosphate acyltransferase
MVSHEVMSLLAETDSKALAAPQPARLRIFVNRFVFRGMLFFMGLIAVALYKILPNKKPVWAFVRAQARNLTRLCGVRVHVRGVERLQHPPYVFVSNHQSHFDIAALLGYLPGQNRFAAKKELFKQPVFGLVLRTLGMIPIDRDDSPGTIERLNRLKVDGHSTVIFPEGTRSTEGKLLPFKKGAFVAAIQLELPIVPVVCKGTADVMPKGGYLSIVPGDVEVVVLDPVPTKGMTYADREGLADHVRALIADELAA